MNAPETKVFKMQDIKRGYYADSNLAHGETVAQQALDACVAEGGKQVFNFDPEKGLPDGYAMAIIPISKKDEAKQERVTIGVCIAAIPTMAEIQKSVEGNGFVLDTIADALITRVANAVRPRTDGSTANVVPFSVADFITSNRPEGVMAGFNEVAPAFVKVLKSKGLSLMTKELLRQILASKAFAEQQHPNIPQASWIAILDGMVSSARKQGLTTAALEEWKTTRDTAGMPQKDDVDLSGLDFGNIV